MGVRRFEIEVPAPFRLDLTVWALRRREHNAIDRFDSGVYRRVLLVGSRILEVAVTQEDKSRSGVLLAVELLGRGRAPSDAAEREVRQVLRRVLGLDVDISGFYDMAGTDDRLTALASRFVGVRPPRFPTVFEALVNAVACQQLSLTVGIHLLNRLSAGFGPAMAPGGPSGFPRPWHLTDVDPEKLRLLGFSGTKARTIVLLARQIENGRLRPKTLEVSDDQAALQTLMGIPGIGRWSAEYTALRGLGRLQVLPGDDVGARNNVARRFGLSHSAGYEDMAALSKSWWPYGGLVYVHLLLDALAEAGYVQPNNPPNAPVSRGDAP